VLHSVHIAVVLLAVGNVGYMYQAVVKNLWMDNTKNDVADTLPRQHLQQHYEQERNETSIKDNYCSNPPIIINATGNNVENQLNFTIYPFGLFVVDLVGFFVHYLISRLYHIS
jgi:hypothetical protein